jgi:hypothetical protein
MWRFGSRASASVSLDLTSSASALDEGCCRTLFESPHIGDDNVNILLCRCICTSARKWHGSRYCRKYGHRVGAVCSFYRTMLALYDVLSQVLTSRWGCLFFLPYNACSVRCSFPVQYLFCAVFFSVQFFFCCPLFCRLPLFLLVGAGVPSSIGLPYKAR